jgi:hypothetical protein
MNQVHAVAGRTDLLVHLVAALDLLPVELAERPVGREMQSLGLAMIFMLGGRLRRRLDEADQVHHQADQEDAGETQPDEKSNDTDHGP